MKENKKNLVYIFADQWRYHALGCTGEDSVRTPNMDEFASGALSGTNAISSYPLCSPHRAALMTGKHPLSCGFWTNCKIGLQEKIMLSPQEVCLQDVLHDNGYENAYIGKWHLDASQMNYHKKPVSGAANWDCYTPPGERRHNIDYWYSYGAMDEHLRPHYWHDTDEMIMADKWSPEHETDVFIDYMENHRDKTKPFAAMISWNPPHPPYDLVPQKYLDRIGEPVFRENVPEEWRKDPGFIQKWKEYYAAVEGLVEQFGRIMQYLKNNDLEDDTIVVLSADHGDCMGSHGVYGKNIWWEESIRIPFYIRGKGLRTGKYDGLFASEDHMPTMLELLGCELPDTVEGVSHAENFRSEDAKCPRDHVYLCMLPGMPNLVDAFKVKGLDSKCYGWRGIRDERYTYLVHNGIEPGQEQYRLLFDNLEDPYQMHGIPLQKDDERARHYDALIMKHKEELLDPFLLDR